MKPFESVSIVAARRTRLKRPAFRFRQLFVLVIACSWSLAGAVEARNLCGTDKAGEDLRRELKRHAILVGSAGDLRDPCTFEPVDDPEQYMQEIRAGIEAYLDTTSDAKILLFAHGGLNRKISSSRRVITSLQQIRQAGTYPIFVNWSSGPVSNLWGAFVRDRGGERAKLATGLVTGPYRVTRSLVEGVAHLPTSWWRSWASDWNALDNEPFGCLTDVSGLDPSVTVEGRGQGAGRFPLINTLTYPVGMVTTPLIDGLGDPAYQSMIRRVNHQFYGVSRSGSGAQGPEIGAWHRGATSRLLIMLSEMQAERGETIELTAIGHSMGAMVVAHMVRLFGDELYFKNIVLMGAALSLAELESAIFPYLAKYDGTERESELYHLMLHRRRERREVNGFGLAPRGSLLVWIDNFFDIDHGTMHRTSGRTENFFRYLCSLNDDRSTEVGQMFEKALKHVHPRRFEVVNWKEYKRCRKSILAYQKKARQEFLKGKAYDAEPPCCWQTFQPQKHGDFDLARFWLSASWTTEELPAADNLLLQVPN